VIPILLWVDLAAGAPPLADSDPLPRYLDEAAVVEAIERGISALSACFPPGSPPATIPVSLDIARDGTVRGVHLDASPGSGPCLEGALSGVRFRPHDEPLDTWTTTVAWVDGVIQPWPVATRVRPPRGPVLVRIPPTVTSAVAEALGVDPFPPHGPAPAPDPGGDPRVEDAH
jgi:hypothetical protein